MTNPILVLAFNRPDKLKLCLDAISGTSVTEVLIFLDGPRVNTNDEEKIDQCVQVISKFKDRFSGIEVIRRTENLGCRRGVQEALTYFFTKFDHGLIVEDDVLISQEFVDFATWALQEYKYDRKIWVVNGWSPFNAGEVDMVPWLSRIPTVWGWATWSDRWKLYDPDIEASLDVIPSELPSNLALPVNEDFNRYWSQCFRLIREGWDTWDYQLVFSMWKDGGMALSPPLRLTQNIGFDGEATHTHRATGRSGAPRQLFGFDKRMYPFTSSETELVVFAEEMQFEYHLKKLSKNKAGRRKNRKTSIVFFLAEYLDGSQFTLNNNASPNLRIAIRWLQLLFLIRRVKAGILKSSRGIRSRFSRLGNHLYWGIRNRFSRLGNHLYWGIRSRFSRIIKRYK